MKFEENKYKNICFQLQDIYYGRVERYFLVRYKVVAYKYFQSVLTDTTFQDSSLEVLLLVDGVRKVPFSRN